MRKGGSERRAVMVRPRVHIGAVAVGPGKIDLLREIAQQQSISAAARAMSLTYKRAWLLIETLNRGFGKPVVEAVAGGKGGGGARLTPLGEALIKGYGALEDKLAANAQPELEALRALLDSEM